LSDNSFVNCQLSCAVKRKKKGKRWEIAVLGTDSICSLVRLHSTSVHELLGSLRDQQAQAHKGRLFWLKIDGFLNLDARKTKKKAIILRKLQKDEEKKEEV
jgi:hypothetical protein